MRRRRCRARRGTRTPGTPRWRCRWAATPPWRWRARRRASTRVWPRSGRRLPGPRQSPDKPDREPTAKASLCSCSRPPWSRFMKKANPMRDVRDCLYWMSQEVRPCRGSSPAFTLFLLNVIVEAALDDAAGEGRVLAAEGALPDGGGLMIVVADEAGDVGVNARDGLAKELVGEVPDA